MNNPSRDAEKGKATQHNLPETVIFKEKLAASGGTRTHDHQLARRCSYQLSYRGSSAGWAESCIHVQSFILSLNSPVYLVCDALVEVLWLLCIVYVIRAQPAELPR